MLQGLTTKKAQLIPSDLNCEKNTSRLQTTNTTYDTNNDEDKESMHSGRKCEERETSAEQPYVLLLPLNRSRRDDERL